MRKSPPLDCEKQRAEKEDHIIRQLDSIIQQPGTGMSMPSLLASSTSAVSSLSQNQQPFVGNYNNAINGNVNDILPTPIGFNVQMVNQAALPFNQGILSNQTSLSSIFNSLIVPPAPPHVPVPLPLVVPQLADSSSPILAPSVAASISGTNSQSSSDRQDRPNRNHRWNEKYSELMEYKATYGHCNIPYNSSSVSRELAEWVKRQRHQHKLKLEGRHSALTDERENLLNQIGFCWDSRS